MNAPMLLWTRQANQGSIPVEVSTFKEASETYRRWIEKWDLGASQLGRGSGRVTKGAAEIARVSYNGRVWTPDGDKLFYDPAPNGPFPVPMVHAIGGVCEECSAQFEKQRVSR